MTKSNPMLAFGAGPEGTVCGECSYYVTYMVGCLKRTGGRSWKHHLADWPACKLFEHRFKGYRKVEESEANS